MVLKTTKKYISEKYIFYYEYHSVLTIQTQLYSSVDQEIIFSDQ